MRLDYEIHKIHKIGIRGNDHFLVVRGKTSYLRIAGDFPRYTIMTAQPTKTAAGTELALTNPSSTKQQNY